MSTVHPTIASLISSCIKLQADPSGVAEVISQAQYIQGLLAYPPASTHDSLVGTVPLRKQWKPLQHIVAPFQQLVHSYFETEEHTNTFLAFFNNRNMAIAGSSVVAAYTGQNSFNDLDIFYTPEANVQPLLTFLGSHGFRAVQHDTNQYDVIPLMAKAKKQRFSSPSIQTYYDNIKHINKVTNFVRDNADGNLQIIQCIEVAYSNVRSHIRNFDLSCCQMFYQTGCVYIRQLYAEITALKCMVLCWENDLRKDKRYAGRVEKYSKRGWTPYSSFPIHQEYSKTIRVLTELDVIQPKSITTLQDLLHQTETYIQFSKVNLAVKEWNNVVKNISEQKQISNVVKQQLSQIFDELCECIIQTQAYHEALSIISYMVKCNDNRWLLLGMLKHQQIFKPYFDSAIYTLATKYGVSRENLLLIKSMMSE